MILIGTLVIARAHAGISLVITLNAPIFAPSLILTGATSTEFEPILTLSSIIVLLFSFVRGL